MVWVPTAIHTNLAQCDVLTGLVIQRVSTTSCFQRFLLIMMVSVPVFLYLLLAKNMVFLKGWLANTACRSVCRGSGTQEPDSIQFLMAGGRDGGCDERARVANHLFEPPCTRFNNYYECRGSGAQEPDRPRFLMTRGPRRATQS